MQTSLTHPSQLMVPGAGVIADDGTPAGAALEMLRQAARHVLGHDQFEDILQLSRRGGLALVRKDGELHVFKLINCQADWKKRLGRRFGWNPALGALRVSAAMQGAGLPLCAVEQQGSVNLPGAPRAVWTLSRFVPNGRTLRQIKLDLQPDRRAAVHPLVQRLYHEALRLLRRIHDAGFEHRDYHAGNLLLSPADAASLAEGNTVMRLVDLETVTVRKATTARRARDLRRFLENFIEPQTCDAQVRAGAEVYAGDDRDLAARLLATRRMAGLLRRQSQAQPLAR